MAIAWWMAGTRSAAVQEVFAKPPFRFLTRAAGDIAIGRTEQFRTAPLLSG